MLVLRTGHVPWYYEIENKMDYWGSAPGITRAVVDWLAEKDVAALAMDNIAVEVIAGTTKHTVKAQGPGTDVKVKETWVLPPVVALQYHFAPAGKISPYVGAGVNYMLFYSGSDKNGFNLDIDDGVGFALQAGVDIATVGPWSANLDVKKIYFETDATDTTNGLKSKVSLDPWVVSAGFGYKF